MFCFSSYNWTNIRLVLVKQSWLEDHVSLERFWINFGRARYLKYKSVISPWAMICSSDRVFGSMQSRWKNNFPSPISPNVNSDYLVNPSPSSAPFSPALGGQSVRLETRALRWGEGDTRARQPSAWLFTRQGRAQCMSNRSLICTVGGGIRPKFYFQPSAS